MKSDNFHVYTLCFMACRTWRFTVPWKITSGLILKINFVHSAQRCFHYFQYCCYSKISYLAAFPPLHSVHWNHPISPSVRPFAFMCSITRQLMNEFLWKLVTWSTTKVDLSVPIFFKMVQLWLPLFLKSYPDFCAQFECISFRHLLELQNISGKHLGKRCSLHRIFVYSSVFP
jgi:hypothetical protein